MLPHFGILHGGSQNSKQCNSTFISSAYHTSHTQQDRGTNTKLHRQFFWPALPPVWGQTVWRCKQYWLHLKTNCMTSTTLAPFEDKLYDINNTSFFWEQNRCHQHWLHLRTNAMVMSTTSSWMLFLNSLFRLSLKVNDQVCTNAYIFICNAIQTFLRNIKCKKSYN